MLPALVAVAIKVTVVPAQIALPGTPDEMVTSGVKTGFTITAEVVLLHPVVASVNVNVTLPDETPVTSPPLVTVAIALSLLVQVPPVVDDKVMPLPTHTDDAAVTTGKGLTVTSTGLVVKLPAQLPSVFETVQ